jgi:putative ABC transport system substrate-binding protein
MAIHIGRRELIRTLVGAAAASPLTARAQQPAMPVVGFLSPGSPEADTGRANAVRQGLKETGYVEAQDVVIEYRWARSHYDDLPALAADLVNRQVTVIVAVATPATLAAHTTTHTIPIVFAIGSDPVQFGLISSLNRPGRNVTGVYVLNVAMMRKRLELLHELLPTAGVIGYLANPKSAFTPGETQVLREAARARGVQLRVFNASNESEVDPAFTDLAKDHWTPLLVSADAMFTDQRVQLIVLSARHNVPTIYSYREFTAAGGLMSYGPDLADAYRQVGIYTGRILKGAKAADLPVQQAVKVELVINLKTAKALGITIPPTLLARADAVIE